ncbi:MAG: molybdenum cofactor biosynthesis protein MoaE [Candidatus Eiseniibacteriota bacterium]
MTERLLTRVTREPLEEDELRRFVRTPASGAVVSFAGVVRNHHEGREVTRIEYAAVIPLAEAKLRDLAQEALEDAGVHRVAAVHRLGTLQVGEASVLVAASAAHRDVAFRAARRLIDRIKEVLPVWKKEHFADGTAAWAKGFAVPEGDRASLPREVGEARPC